MKKIIMTFAVMAFLIGGLTINANAQDKKAVNKAKVESTQDKAKTGANKDVNKKVDIDQMIKDYSINVDKYIEAYKAALKGESGDKNTYNTYKKNAQNLEKELLKLKDKMSTTQANLFEKFQKKFADALTEK